MNFKNMNFKNMKFSLIERKKLNDKLESKF